METPRELDVVEVIVDGAEVPRGAQGTVIDDPGDGTLLLEVVGPDGETKALPIVSRHDVHVVWRQKAQHLEAAVAERDDG